MLQVHSFPPASKASSLPLLERKFLLSSDGRDQLFGHSTHEMDFYGSSQDLDRLLTICHSNEIKDQLVRNFNLYQHYDIDSTGALANHKIRTKLDKLMTIIKTKYDAIDLSIEDKDKILAASMANAARKYR